MNKKLPLECPSCSSRLKVKSLVCDTCDTTVSGMYDLPTLTGLNSEDQLFITEFVKASGSLKVMAQQLKLSYPTVRNLLDSVINKLKENDG
ncbi:MAG: hypothetical protein ACJA2S_004998 [Cyclobacteriaceae bacterium]|jgi:hypothetical protein